MELNGCYRIKVNSKAFAIPILLLDYKGRCSQNRDSKCFRINFYSITTIEFHLASTNGTTQNYRSFNMKITNISVTTR